MRDINVKRPILGPFMSVICFRYLHDGATDLAGRALVVDAGRQRGQDLVEELGLQGNFSGTDDLLKSLQNALGPDGTKLCLIGQITQTEEGGFEVHATESASSIYTLGVLTGAISGITGKTMLGEEVNVSDKDEVESHIYAMKPL